jgi:hypothetical protein
VDVQELLDREAIRDVLHHYCWCLDSQEPERLAKEFYTDDAIDDHAAVVVEGADKIVQFLRQVCTWSQGHAHVLSNIRIAVDGDTAHAESYFTAWHWLAGTAGRGGERPADFVSVGRYIDDLRRESNGWRVAHRRVETSAPGYTAVGAFPDVELEPPG